MAKNVTSADIFGDMFKNIPDYLQESRTAVQEDGQKEQEVSGGGKKAEIVRLNRSCLHPFKNHPYRVVEDEQMRELAESIRKYGIKEPILVRPDKEGDGYEIISGHRRNYAAGLAGIESVPVHIEKLSDDDAAVLMVDSNNKREILLASEKAWAYRIKADALRHQGKRNDLADGENASDGLRAAGEPNGDSIRTVQRYIRLTYLNQKLLALVDEEKMPVGIGYSISFFSCEEQNCIMNYYEKHHLLPNSTQIEIIAELRKNGTLNEEALEKILTPGKVAKPAKMNITLKNDRLRRYFPEDSTKEYMENIIMELLEQWSSRNGSKR